MKSKRVLGLAALLLGFGLALTLPTLRAGQEMSAQDQKMMEQMMKYGTPGKNHEFLKMYAGEWDVEISTWQNPGAPPLTSKGTMKNTVIFDGRYLKCDFEGEMSGMKFTGLEVIGYDLFKNTYTTFWIDSMSTGFLTTSGKLDPTGKVLTETGVYPDAMTDGKTMQRVKNVTTFLTDEKYRFEMFMVGLDGKEMKSMDMMCTRRGR